MRILSWIGMILLGFGAIEFYIHYKVARGVQIELNKELIKIQNEAINKKALNTQNYLKEMPKTQEKITTKYKNVYIKDGECKERLKEIRNAMDLYFNTTTYH